MKPNNTTIAKYIYIRNDIAHKIDTGEYPPNLVLPSESEICRDYNVSRVTARKSIELLAKDGYIISQKGKGSFVNNNIYKNINKIYSFTEIIQSQGKTAKRKIIEFKKIEADAETKKDLLLEQNDVYKLVILYYADDLPYVYNEVYLNASLFPNLHAFNFESISLYETLREFFNLVISKSEYTINATLPDKYIQELLEVDQTHPVLEIDAISYCDYEQLKYIPFEKYRVYVRTDIIKYMIKNFND